MTAQLQEFADLISSLAAPLARLEQQAASLKLAPLSGREWFDLLERKLIPQLEQGGFLVVAVTGGTNIGKSVVFNHLAGFRASASSPLASGTKHPVCLVPTGFEATHDLQALFPTFKLVPWSDAQQSLTDDDRHLLFWRSCESVPPNLLLMDTPDIDSDAPVNWARADAIRQSADILIAVLTQQKYNDAAVKQFFRTAAGEGKPAVVVFNQCELPDDEAYWPLWMTTFSRETRLVPLYVYLAPNDRRAAEAIRLEFQERHWQPRASDVSNDAAPDAPAENSAIPEGGDNRPVPLQDVFSRFRFEEIKLQTLRGALECVASPVSGLPAYLSELASRSREFRMAADVLSAHQLAEVDDWPAPPAKLLVAEVRRWWAEHRQGWSAGVHLAYDQLGQAIFRPLRWLRDRTQGPPPPPWAAYREREWSAILRVVSKVYQKLEWIADLGQPLLRNRIEQRLSGISRAQLIQQIEAIHRQFAFDDILSQAVETELSSFRTENPQLFQWVQRIDEATAAARPMLTIVLGVTGVGLPIGEAAAHFASQGIFQGAMHVAGDAVAGAATATVGESAISATASSGAGYLQAKVHRLQEAFSRQRVSWLAAQLETQFLGALTTELEVAAWLPQTAEFQQLQALTKKLQQSL